MATVPLSPSELAYLHATLSQTPPIRPDGRRATQFRALSAETGILPGANGSARVCFADGSEAIVGVKAEIERTVGWEGEWQEQQQQQNQQQQQEQEQQQDKEAGRSRTRRARARGRQDWVEMAIEVPGARDDDANTSFLEAMIREAVLADGALVDKLVVNARFHWRLYLDVSRREEEAWRAWQRKGKQMRAQLVFFGNSPPG
jgi:exosome complex component RRP42